jgi:hypothetical protein
MDEETESPTICLRCIGDDDLRSQLQTEASQITCSYCQTTGPGITVQHLAREVDETLRFVLRPGQTSQHFNLDSDKSFYEQDGDILSLYVQELLKIDDAAAEAVVEALIDNDPADPRDGDEPFYASDQLYERAESEDWEFSETWREFSETLKHDQRFFGRAISEDLARILGEPGSTEAAELPVLILGQGNESSHLFRARRAVSAEKAREFVSDPQNELCAPLPEAATAGRMNPAGISVFYGATSEDVAIAEVRPSVGSLVVVGSFVPIRPLRLLDLTQLRGLKSPGSVFAPGYKERVSRAQFLRGFHRLVVQPVQPQDEPLEYLPTQAVAEYVRNSLGFDGILYASTQVGTLNKESLPKEETVKSKPAYNAVVFGKSRREYSSDPWSVPTIRGTITDHPLTHEAGSAHVVHVRSVSYESNRIDLDDQSDDAETESDDF